MLAIAECNAFALSFDRRPWGNCFYSVTFVMIIWKTVSRQGRSNFTVANLDDCSDYNNPSDCNDQRDNLKTALTEDPLLRRDNKNLKLKRPQISNIL